MIPYEQLADALARWKNQQSRSTPAPQGEPEELTEISTGEFQVEEAAAAWEPPGETEQGAQGAETEDLPSGLLRIEPETEQQAAPSDAPAEEGAVEAEEAIPEHISGEAVVEEDDGNKQE